MTRASPQHTSSRRRAYPRRRDLECLGSPTSSSPMIPVVRSFPLQKRSQGRSWNQCQSCPLSSSAPTGTLRPFSLRPHGKDHEEPEKGQHLRMLMFGKPVSVAEVNCSNCNSYNCPTAVRGRVRAPYRLGSHKSTTLAFYQLVIF